LAEVAREDAFPAIPEIEDSAMSDQPAVNTDREIWREREGDYYADSIHVTAQGSIGIDCGGMVYTLPVREWHALASRAALTGTVRPVPEGAVTEADVYEQAATLGIPATGGDFLAGIEAFRKQLRLKASKIRSSGTQSGSPLLSDPDRVSDSLGVRESEESTSTNHLAAAIALAVDRGCGGGLIREDFDVASSKSKLGNAWRDAGLVLATLTKSSPVEAVAVKPLEWTKDGFAHTDFGLFYYLEDDPTGVVLEKHTGSSVMKSFWSTPASAKIEAQFDYETRIRSALAPAPLSNPEAPAAPVARDCATEGCGNSAAIHFIRGNVGAYYCSDCYMRIQAIPAALVATPPAPNGLVKERDEAISLARQWKDEAERLRSAHRCDTDHPIMTLEDVITWLKYHRFTHSEWASWFEAHPDDPRIKSGIGTADFHRKVEARYNEMIRCLTATPAQPAPTSAVDGEEAHEFTSDPHRTGKCFNCGRHYDARVHDTALSKAQAAPATLAVPGEMVAWQYRYKHNNPNAIWSEWGEHQPALSSYQDWIEEKRPLFAHPLPKAPIDAGVVETLLREAREEIDRYADTAREHDLVARIDAALPGDRP